MYGSGHVPCHEPSGRPGRLSGSSRSFKRYAWEEAEHAAKFAELLGDVVWDTKTNLKKRMEAEAGACEDKKRIATLAKQQNLDAIHDTVHEMPGTRLVTEKVRRTLQQIFPEIIRNARPAFHGTVDTTEATENRSPTGLIPEGSLSFHPRPRQ